MPVSSASSRRAPGRPRSRPHLVLALLIALVAALGLTVTSQSPARAAGTLLSQGRPATASSIENASFGAAQAVDGNDQTRWSSAFADPQWIMVDLGSVQPLTQVTLKWEAAYAKAFTVQTATGPNGPWTTVYSTTAGTGGVQNLNVSGSGRYVRMYGTQRATPYGYSLWEFQVYGGSGGTTPPDAFWGTTDDIPPSSGVMKVKVLNRTGGAYPDSQVYWSYNGQEHSIAEQPYVDIVAAPAQRMYFYVGSPNGQYYDFIEFTTGTSSFSGNTTRVDAWGLPLAIRLHSHSGQDVQLGDAQDLFTMTRDQVFQNFQNSVPQQFKVLAQTQAPYRIIAPGSDPSFRSDGANANYFTAYANSVGVNEPTSNIFGCAGSLASNAALCAALNRHTADLPAAQQQDPSKFYGGDPANWYAKYWHDHAINHLAYGFPYDDVAGQAAYTSMDGPQWMEVAVGY
ncbi:beta-1,3-glucanase family protein [Streptomyces griseofuscus]|uniref:beta-1,3-glucanase family protein n=1 Tax=Streptomyces griseofuscus TaxID=146922 RepID=UPI0036B90878